ncbi:MAG: 23S rRNA (guanosine(2251)-2'-O)-methyltransferase RlmB [Desulfobulbaceae bacterium]|nr:23S rRNA (guanosine(2251)-2'-O)-methyltransferase RlmB [Desulfobulbaceae bacterium]
MQKKEIELKGNTDKKVGDDANMLWGINPVKEFCLEKPGEIVEIYVQKGKANPKLQEIIDLARGNGIRLRFVEMERIGLPLGCRHQGIAAKRGETVFYELEELLSHVDEVTPEGEFSRILVLDCLQDPHNLGAILRSALAAGFAHVIVTRERSAPFSGTVAKVSAGALAHLRISRVINLAETLKTLKKRGYWVFGAVAEQNGVSIYQADFSIPLCLIIGGEGSGIRPLVQKQCDHLITIPMIGNFNSLNASAAAAVIMFEVRRRQLSA